MDGGNSAEGMVDLTGGLTEIVELKPKAPDNFFQTLLQANERASLMGCSIKVRKTNFIDYLLFFFNKLIF